MASQPAFNQAVQILTDLTECGLELKMEFPFEHLLLDAIMYSGMLEESGGQGRQAELEKLTQTLLAIPIPQVRERILRTMYQRLRVGVSGGQQLDGNLQKPAHLAKFVLRKGILNHFVNGILINKEIADFEETQLQMSVGQLIVKIMILAFNEFQGAGLQSVGISAPQALSSFLLTFQCLLPQYNELISLIELIEEGGQKNCRYLRILRDLFCQVDHKREFATNVLRSSFSLDCQEEHIQDMLKCTFDLR